MASHREIMPNGRMFLTAGALTLLVTLALCNGSGSRNYQNNNSQIESPGERNSLGRADLPENTYSRQSGNYDINKR